MLYLIQQIWIWIVVAALIGFLFGWLLRWRVTLERVDKMEDDLMLIRAARDRLEQDNKRLNVRLAALETEGAPPRDKPQKLATTTGSSSGARQQPGLTAPQPGGPDELNRIHEEGAAQSASSGGSR